MAGEIVKDIQNAQGTTEQHIDKTYNFYPMELESLQKGLNQAIQETDNLVQYGIRERKAEIAAEKKRADADLSDLYQDAQDIVSVMQNTKVTPSEIQDMTNQYFRYHAGLGRTNAEMTGALESAGYKEWKKAAIDPSLEAEVERRRAIKEAEIKTAQRMFPTLKTEEAERQMRLLSNDSTKIGQYLEEYNEDLTPEQREELNKDITGSFQHVLAVRFREHFNALQESGNTYTNKSVEDFSTALKKSLIEEGVDPSVADYQVSIASGFWKLQAKRVEEGITTDAKQLDSYIKRQSSLEVQRLYNTPITLTTGQGEKINMTVGTLMNQNPVIQQVIMNTLPHATTESLIQITKALAGGVGKAPLTEQDLISLNYNLANFGKVQQNLPDNSKEEKNLVDTVTEVNRSDAFSNAAKNPSNPVNLPLASIIKFADNFKKGTLGGDKKEENDEAFAEQFKNFHTLQYSKHENRIILFKKNEDGTFIPHELERSFSKLSAGEVIDTLDSEEFERGIKPELIKAVQSCAYLTDGKLEEYVDMFNTAQIVHTPWLNEDVKKYPWSVSTIESNQYLREKLGKKNEVYIDRFGTTTSQAKEATDKAKEVGESVMSSLDNFIINSMDAGVEAIHYSEEAIKKGTEKASEVSKSFLNVARGYERAVDSVLNDAVETTKEVPGLVETFFKDYDVFPKGAKKVQESEESVEYSVQPKTYITAPFSGKLVIVNGDKDGLKDTVVLVDEKSRKGIAYTGKPLDVARYLNGKKQLEIVVRKGSVIANIMKEGNIVIKSWDMAKKTEDNVLGRSSPMEIYK